jgi:hypothetical protein
VDWKRDGGRGGRKVAAVVELEQGAGLGEDGAEKGEQGRLDGDGEMVVDTTIGSGLI